MAYNKGLYVFAFLPIVLLIYQIVPKKMRWTVLLFASYVFFVVNSKSKWVVVFIIGATIYTYFIAIWIKKLQIKLSEKTSDLTKKELKQIKIEYKNKTKKVLILGIVGLLATLIYTHYTGFFAESIDKLLAYFGCEIKVSRHIKQPLFSVIGISFFTLEAIGYMVDVYWEKIDAEKNPFKLGLFLSFFPQLMQGPIAIYSKTKEKLFKGDSVTVSDLKKGYTRILWGMLKIYLVSVRLTPVTDYLFNNWQNLYGAEIILASVCYTTQLYMDFSGSIDICIGSANLFGIELLENFRQPFAAKSASEFWQRWHITLGLWFKTYIFYPVSVSKVVKKWNKFAKKKISKYVAKVGVSAICLLPVWLCNGLWHGPKGTYIFYGIYYFVILLLEVALEPIRKGILKISKLKEDGTIWRTFLSIKTLIIIFVGELFFNAVSLKAGFTMFFNMFKNFDILKICDMNYLTHLGTNNLIIENGDYVSVLIGVVAVTIYGALKERGIFNYEKLDSMKTPYKWAIYYALFFAIILLGAYGEGYDEVALLYANF